MASPEFRRGRYTAALQFAEHQVKSLVERHPDFFPMYTVGGKWRHAGEKWTQWTDGFLGGMMWQFYVRDVQEAAGEASSESRFVMPRTYWRQRAEHYSKLLEHRQ